MAKSVVFYYDVVCPFAYMASRLIEGLGRRTGALVEWRPVLLGELAKTRLVACIRFALLLYQGGLYEATEAPQGKAGSATQGMSVARMQCVAQGKLKVVLCWTGDS